MPEVRTQPVPSEGSASQDKGTRIFAAEGYVRRRLRIQHGNGYVSVTHEERVAPFPSEGRGTIAADTGTVYIFVIFAHDVYPISMIYPFCKGSKADSTVRGGNRGIYISLPMFHFQVFLP